MWFSLVWGGNLCCTSFHAEDTDISAHFIHLRGNFPEHLRGFPALVSQTQPKLAPSGHLSLQLVLKQCPVTKKAKERETTFRFNVHLLVFIWILVSFVWSDLISLHYFIFLYFIFLSLDELLACTHCLPVCPSVRPSVPSHIPAQGNEHWRTLVLSLYPN